MSTPAQKAWDLVQAINSGTWKGSPPWQLSLFPCTSKSSASDPEHLKEMHDWVKEWLATYKESQLKTVSHNATTILRYVARFLYCFKIANIKELTIFDSKENTAIISEDVFKEDARNALSAVVKITSPDTTVKHISVQGEEPFEIQCAEDATNRFTYLFLLAYLSQGKWQNSGHSTDLSAVKETRIGLSWITEMDMKRLCNAKKAKNRRSSEALEVLNVFIIGMRSSGKSTTQWLLTGKEVEEDGNADARKKVHLVSDNDNNMNVWDTNGYENDSVSGNRHKENVRRQMISAQRISALVLQAQSYKEPSDKELRMVKEFEQWFGKSLKQNLMVVLKVGRKEAKKFIEKWEKAIGKIGRENYICLDANSEKKGKEIILESNKEEICKAKKVMKAKKFVVATAIDKVAQAVGNLSDETLQENTSQQEFDKFKVSLRDAVKIRPKFNTDTGDLNFTYDLKGAKKSKKTTEQFALTPVGHDAKRFLLELSTMSGGTDDWIKRLKDPSFKFTAMARNDLRRKKIFEVIPDILDESIVRDFLNLLRSRKVSEYLES